MNNKLILLFGALFVFINGCKNHKQKQAKKIPQKKIAAKRKPVRQKRTAPQKYNFVQDTITTKNAVKFFKNYGKKHPETKVLIKTRLGNITLKLYKNTPIHRASFLYLIRSGYFNFTCFHRVVPDFIIQGGDGDNPYAAIYRKQLNHYRIPAEFRKNRPHKTGCIAAARSWKNNPKKLSTPFQFYFIQGTQDYGHLNGEHTVFGEIIKGVEILDKIAKEPLDKKEWPQENVDITMKILK